MSHKELEIITDKNGKPLPQRLNLSTGKLEVESDKIQKEILSKLDELLNKESEGSYVGYSTDDKNEIAPNAERNNQFLELDTKDVYFYDGSEWVLW